MIATTLEQILTFEEYLTYEDGTDNRYELERGVLVEMGKARGQHGEIMQFYNKGFYQKEQVVEISTFPKLRLTAHQILQAKL